jgi:hypothetical protein
MTTVLKMAKGLRFLCDLGLGGGLVGLVWYIIWFGWVLLSPVLTGGTPHRVRGVVSMAVGEAGGGQMPPISPLILGGPDTLGGGAESVLLNSLPITVVSHDSSKVIDPKFSGTIGAMLFQTSNWKMHILLFLSALIPQFLFLWILYLIRQFLVDAVQGTPFSLDNAKRLKWIGLVLLGIGVVKPMLNGLTGNLLLSSITVQGPVLTPWIDLHFISACVLIALFSLIISISFRHGVELEKEHSLTV